MTQEQEPARLTPPVGERDHVEGAAEAPVSLVEYGDFECPYCGQAYPIVKEIQRQLGDQVRVVFRNFPLAQIHPHAEQAAEAAEAAGGQGHFWQMHDELFEHQQDLDTAHLHRYAQAVGLDLPQFDEAVSQHTWAARVREDFQSGVRSGVNGTPTFFINGVRHDGSYGREALLAAIEAARTRSS